MTAVPDPGPVPPGASGKTFASRTAHTSLVALALASPTARISRTRLASRTALAAVAVSGAVAALRPEVRK